MGPLGAEPREARHTGPPGAELREVLHVGPLGAEGQRAEGQQVRARERAGIGQGAPGPGQAAGT
jgi:hypothetical protein